MILINGNLVMETIYSSDNAIGSTFYMIIHDSTALYSQYSLLRIHNYDDTIITFKYSDRGSFRHPHIESTYHGHFYNEDDILI
ncbi:MAG: hypothetical protein LBT10_01665 [Methanobrevibacter sp.]|jgi:hypothetical protein|nr:hypothetical protein [Methanobrevibacter sp.]